MSHLIKYQRELLTYLGRFYQDTTEFTFEMLPIRIQNKFDKMIPFLKRLEEDGFIEIEFAPTFLLKIKKIPPNYDYIK